MVGDQESNIVASSTDPNEATKPAEPAETDPEDAPTKIVAPDPEVTDPEEAPTMVIHKWPN
jgi:hypothetical protein